MNTLKKFVAAAALAITIATSTTSFAAQGSGYSEGRSAPHISPTVALGTVAAVAIIALVIQNRHHSKYSGHNHAH